MSIFYKLLIINVLKIAVFGPFFHLRVGKRACDSDLNKMFKSFH